ncbi:ribonuclease R [Roseospira marina]|uniref:ribonuclease R n=1 Tax=Roseospira marina TaxID=140057 RepID=UPI00147890CB|nr:ribonuclease R [Roseospira marina]MBB4314376.1 ribonuclease R [Roseospira marina]MBB5087536.1 ribonuclease R [Roseospira marina]
MPPQTPKKQAPFPTREQVVAYIRDNPDHVGKREIARAFNLNAEQRPLLRALLKDLEKDGTVQRGRKRRFAPPGTLPEVTVLTVHGTDADGELLARPDTWDADELGPPPRVLVLPMKGRHAAAIGVGDRVLARVARDGDSSYVAKPIKRLASAPTRLLGVLAEGPDGWRLRPTNKRDRNEYIVRAADRGEGGLGDLVEAEIVPGRTYGLRMARVLDRLGDTANPRAVSLICLHTHGIPTEWPPEAEDQAKAAGPTPPEDRDDLRDVPLVTIDGEDARDFDDAVWAESDPDPDNPDGWHAMVAIADVAWYVRPGDALDDEALRRGNSVYFPDRVVPMLPEALSNGWCSLRPNEDGGCLAVEMWFDARGQKIRHQFRRGIMRSAARLTYTQVQMAVDGTVDDTTGPLVEPLLRPLYGVFAALSGAREKRGSLELDLPERRVMVGEDGTVLGIQPRARYDSHRLIEELMVAANVCAAEELERLREPCLYRIHDEPSQEKLGALRDFLRTLDISLAPGQVMTPHLFNRVLERARDTEHEHLVNEVVLRAQAQAEYNPDNIGHFGLGLRRYAHFTSPIRRYADLMVHRALIRGLRLGAGALEDDQAEQLAEIGGHISSTERRAAAAERDAVNRFIVGFLAGKVGATFSGRVNGVTRAGLFVTLDDTGADGLIPISTLPADFYWHNEDARCLEGREHGRVYRLGQPVTVRLREADPLVGGLLFEVLDDDGTAPAGRRGPRTKAGGPKGGRPKTGGPGRRHGPPPRHRGR